MRMLVPMALLVFLLTGETAAAPAICDPKRDGQATESTELQEASSDSEVTKVDIKTLTSTHFQLSNGTELQIHPISQPLFKYTNGTRRKLGDFRSAHLALVATQQGGGVCPLCAATTLIVVSEGCLLDFVHSLPFLAPVWDAETKLSCHLFETWDKK